MRHGDAVLKPVEDAAEAGWVTGLLSTVEQQGFRVPRPLRAQDGRWVVDGWTATEFVAGEAAPVGRWGQLLAASRAFHAALAATPRPEFLDGRTHRWAHADRVAWGDGDVDVVPRVGPYLARLQQISRPAWAGPDFAQLLVRALIFRLVALNERARGTGASSLAELPLFARAIDTVDELVAG
ncbi:MAG: hypothetical protein ACR2LX_10075 [Jatrophihabitans sp.]